MAIILNIPYTRKNICLKLPNYLETHDKILKQRTFTYNNLHLLGFLL